MPYRVLGVALAMAVSCLGAPAQSAATADASVAALLLKHRTFAGWQLGDGTFKTLLLSRRYVDSEGNATQVATERRAGLVYRTTTFLPNREAVTDDAGFTGNIFWTSSQNGFTTPLYGDLAKVRYSYNLLLQRGHDRAVGRDTRHRNRRRKAVRETSSRRAASRRDRRRRRSRDGCLRARRRSIRADAMRSSFISFPTRKSRESG